MASLLSSTFRTLRKFPQFQVMQKNPIYYKAGRCLFSNESDVGNIYTPPDAILPIPAYVEKQGEVNEIKRARLLYQSRKRGMLENGLLLSTFASKYLDTFTDGQLSSYDKLINQPSNDWDIYYWVTGVTATPEEFQSDVMDLLKKHARNEEKNFRICQPDL